MLTDTYSGTYFQSLYREPQIINLIEAPKLNNFTHKVMVGSEVYCLSRGFNAAVMSFGPLRMKHGEIVSLKRIRPRVIDGGKQ